MRNHSPPLASTKIGVLSHSCASSARASSLPVMASHSAGVNACTGLTRTRKPACSGSRRANSEATKWPCRSPRPAEMALIAAPRSWLLPSEDIASCRPSGQPSVRSCNSAQASASTASPKRARSSAMVSSRRKCSAGAATSASSPRASQSDSGRSSRLREASTTRRFGGAFNSR
jgi:hypothetical protein